ncbi:hypothetical protein WMY93_019687 [Mugilogobius chulae]|uniref:CCHC-type domain-containing protein n=1 Tax=Mugilogobius chulae TaxID=88201 RepID=A0AAW0NS54_9GOBI
MEDQLRALQELVAELKADNERLRQEQSQSVSDASAVPSASSAEPTVTSAPSNQSIDRLVFVPRDRKCPMFREGEARDEIKYRSAAERTNPTKITAILQDLYGCSESYVALQEAFFCRRQQEGETLLEYSLALMSLMDKVKQRAPNNTVNFEILLRDQFVEQVLDGALRRELKQYVRNSPNATLLDVRGEAIRWEREGLPAGARGRSNSVPSAFGMQYVVQGGYQRPVNNLPPTGAGEMSEMKELLRRQQEQLDKLTQSVARLHTSHQRGRSPRPGPIICNRCHQPGHIARDCDGTRVPRQQPAVRGPFQPRQPSEN